MNHEIFTWKAQNISADLKTGCTSPKMVRGLKFRLWELSLMCGSAVRSPRLCVQICKRTFS